MAAADAAIALPPIRKARRPMGARAAPGEERKGGIPTVLRRLVAPCLEAFEFRRADIAGGQTHDPVARIQRDAVVPVMAFIGFVHSLGVARGLSADAPG
jgi:hypothetical protein